MTLDAILVMLDVATGFILLAKAFARLNCMCKRTSHVVRFANITLAVGALAMAASPMMDQPFRRYAHVAVIVAIALLAVFERRRESRSYMRME